MEYSTQLLQLMDSLGPCEDDCDASAVLEQICRQSVTIARKVRPTVTKHQYYHDGWSPIFIVMRAQLVCLINIRRGLCGWKHVSWQKEDRTPTSAPLLIAGAV